MNTALEKNIFLGFTLLCAANLICFFPDLLMGTAPTGAYRWYNAVFRVSTFASCIALAFCVRFVSVRTLRACAIGGHLFLFAGIATSVTQAPCYPVISGCLCGIGLPAPMMCWFAFLSFVKERSQASIQGLQVAFSGCAVAMVAAFAHSVLPWASMACIAGSLVESIRAWRILGDDSVACSRMRADFSFEPMKEELHRAVPSFVGFVLLALLYGAIAGIVLGNDGSPLGSAASIAGAFLGAVSFLIWLRFSHMRNYAAIAEAVLICVALLLPFVPVDISVLALSFGFQICGLMLFSHCVDAFATRPRLIAGTIAVAYGMEQLVFLAGLYIPGQFDIGDYTAFTVTPSLSVALAYAAFIALFLLFVRTDRKQKAEISALEERLAREASRQNQPNVIPAGGGGIGFDAACTKVFDAHGLTKREAEIAALLARGRDAGYICDELYLARNTVKGYTKRIYAKLEIHSKQELINLIEQTASDRREDQATHSSRRKDDAFIR